MNTHAADEPEMPLLLEDENERLLAGIAAADAGELIDYDDVKAEIHAKLATLSAKR